MPTQPLYSQTILPIVQRTREMLLPHFGNTGFRDKQSGATEDIVTELDTRVEQFFKDEFAKIYPAIPFVGEEYGGNRTSEKFWLVDPIDGTSSFVRGLPFCTTMVTLVEKGEVIFSVIYDFVNDIMYSAEKGTGAYANGKPIHVSDRPLRQARVAWWANLENPEQLRAYLSLTKRCHTFHTGASGIEFTMIASGKLDGTIYLNPGSKDYDVAAGAFLVSEAGGIVANIGKKTYDYTNISFIAANPIIFGGLTDGPNAIFPLES
ncbi:MAG: inositol monophosphatase [bacterium]|nr:inositol monophosphatase [bacterium]